MISYLKGILIDKKPTEAVVEVNGIAFSLIIPVSSFEKLGELNSEVKILTYLHVREDALVLFGFTTESERELFEILISVSGVGPKLAIGILSGVSANEFKNFILQKRYASLVAINGIGKKTAERLVVELYDKISKMDFSKAAFTPRSEQNLEIKNQAIGALCSLGYSRNVAEKSVAAAILDSNDMNLEEIIKKSLKMNLP